MHTLRQLEPPIADRSGLLRSGFVFMNNAANAVEPAHAVLVVVHRCRKEIGERRALLEGTVRPMRVVVPDVLAQHPLQVFARDDQEPVQTLGTVPAPFVRAPSTRTPGDVWSISLWTVR
jgi:hypothetical protein